MQIGNTVVTVDAKKAAVIKWSIIGVCCVVAAPLAIVLLKGVLALGAAALCLAFGVLIGPGIADKMAIQRIKMAVDDAEKNPIENLQNEYNQMELDAKQFEKEVTAFAAEADSFDQQTQDFKKEFPADAPMFDKQLKAYRDLQVYKEQAFQQALSDLKNMAGVVKRAKALWKMSQATERMNKLAGARDEDVFARIRKETALDSVRTATNASFAQVRVALLKTVETATPPQQALGAPTDAAMQALQSGQEQAAQIGQARVLISKSN
jgi:uncharacterized membrane-anchored protein YhcB (DUF1043 family)